MLGLTAGMRAANENQPERVTATQLVGSPQQFSGKRVIVEGYWITGFEWSYLSSKPDNSQPLPIWLERWMMNSSEPPIDIAAIASAVDKADQAAILIPTNSSRQYWIKCIGRFAHVTVRRSTREKPGLGFGHVGVYPSQFRLEKIIEIRAMPLPKDFLPELPE